MMQIFKDITEYSWRKILTCLSGLMFFIDAFLLWYRGEQLPGTHLGIIISVFAFYFGKEAINLIGKKKKDNGNTE